VVDPVEEVGQRDLQDDRVQLLAGVVLGGGLRDLVGDPGGAVLDPGGGLGQRQRGTLLLGEERGL